MESGTVDEEKASPAARARAAAIREVVSSAADVETDRWVDAVAMLIVDSVTSAQLLPLETFLDEAARLGGSDRIDPGSLNALAAVANWGVARTLPEAIGRTIDLASAAGRILSYVANHPGTSSKDLALTLNLDDTRVSKVGNQLECDGLVLRIRAGKWRHWRITRAGEVALQAALLIYGDVRAGEEDVPSHVTEALRAVQHFSEYRQRSNSDLVPSYPTSEAIVPTEEFQGRINARKWRRHKVSDD